MAIAVAQLGGIGVLHRFLSIEEEAADVRRVKRYLSHVVAEPYTIEAAAPLAQAREEAERLDVTGFLVVDADQRLLGLLTARDLAAGEPGDPVATLMTPRERLVTASPGIGLDEARRLLHANRVEKLPLVDDDDRVAGLVTLRDLASVERYPHATRDDQGRLRVAGRRRGARRLPRARRGARRGRGRRARARHRARPRRRGDRGGAGAEGGLPGRRGRGGQRRHRRRLRRPRADRRRRRQGRHRARLRVHDPARGGRRRAAADGRAGAAPRRHGRRARR